MRAHLTTIQGSLKTLPISMRHRPFSCELIERHILDCTRANLYHAKNRFCVQSDPGAAKQSMQRHIQDIIDGSIRSMARAETGLIARDITAEELSHAL